MLLGIAPVRISLAGGGTDYPDYFEKFGGRVIETSISKYVYVILNERSDDSFQAFSTDFQTHQQTTSFQDLQPKTGTEIAVSVIKHLNYNVGTNLLICSDVPPGSGLGSSGSLAVNLVNSLSKINKKSKSKQELAETAFHIGRNILKWPIGKQDEYAASFGGFNEIIFSKDKISVNPIVKKNLIQELEENLLLFFVGETRDSSTILSHQIENIKNNQNDIVSSLQTVSELSNLMYDKLKNSDLTSFGELLHKGWETKKKFAPNVSNTEIDKIYESALEFGALGGKLTGAGGGGHLLLYCEKQKQSNLIGKMTSLGLKNIEFKFEKEGAKILNLYDFVQM